MHSPSLLGVLIIYPVLLMMAMPLLGALIFYGFFTSVILNIYFLSRQKLSKRKQND